MSLPEKRGLLIFCEGDHDVVLIRMLLKDHLGFSEEKWCFSQFPAPFNNFFPARMKNHAATDLELGLAHDFFLPNYVLSRGDQIIMLFKTGGDRKTEMLKQFLTHLTKLMTKGSMFPSAGDQAATAIIKNISYLFVYDADEHGPIAIRNRAWEDFQNIGGTDWLTVPWEVAPDNPLAAQSQNKSIYVWSANGNTGTIEDLFYPAFALEQREFIEKSAEFAEDMFGQAEPGIAALAKRKKATMTIAGQGKKPGLGLHLILKESKLIKTTHLLAVPAIQQFITFLKIHI